VNFAKLSREEAENFVNDPLYRENFKLSGNQTTEIEQESTDENIISKLSGIENQLKQINKHLDFSYLSWLFVGLGVLIGWLFAVNKDAKKPAKQSTKLFQVEFDFSLFTM